MRIQFSTENAAFKDEYADDIANNVYMRNEIARILKKTAAYIENGYSGGPIMDLNGNKIGSWQL